MHLNGTVRLAGQPRPTKHADPRRASTYSSGSTEGVVAVLNSAASVVRVARILEHAYGSPRHGNLDDPLDELVFIKLGQQTNHSKFVPMYQSLRQRFHSWDDALEAGEEVLSEFLRPLGLHRQRAHQLVAMWQQIRSECGSVDLQWLQRIPYEEAISYLAQLRGVGMKSAYCVAMYTLRAPVLPVDTHVERLALRLGWIPEHIARRSRQGNNHEIHRRLEALVPPGLRYSLHVNTVAHGRAVCTTRRPRCGICPLVDLCPTGRAEQGASH